MLKSIDMRLKRLLRDSGKSSFRGFICAIDPGPPSDKSLTQAEDSFHNTAPFQERYTAVIYPENAETIFSTANPISL